MCFASFRPALVAALCAALLALSPLAAGAQSAEKGTEPDWISVAPMPEASGDAVAALRARVVQGNFYHLVDSQIRWTDTGREDYFRVAIEVTDRAGLESAAAISTSFDPASESVTLTRLDILRGDERRSVIDQVEWDVFRRETRLEAGIIDGSLTAVIQVPGLKVGDIVDYSLLRQIRGLYDGDLNTVRRRLEWDDPVILARQVALWPAGRRLVLAPLPDRVEYRAKPEGGFTRLEFVRRNSIPVAAEKDTPPEDEPYAMAHYADRDDWAGVVDAFGAHYWADYALPPEWEARVAEIARLHAAPADRALAALRLVQDEVRYVSLSVGAGGYLARSPEEVLTSGFGDCKDKSLLLVTLLDRLGVKAEVALTDLDRGHELVRLLPQLGAFDHMIVRLRIGGRTYWADPTSSHQGGSLADTVVPDVGFALPLVPGQSALEPVRLSRAMAWQSKVVEDFDFTPLGLTLGVTSRYMGASADYWRYRLATRGASAVEEGFLEFYAGRYPGIRLRAAMEVADDRAANVLTLWERYDLPQDALAGTELAKDFFFGTEDLTQSLREAIRPGRQSPLLLGRERLQQHEVVVRRAPINFRPPENVKISNDAFAFSFRGAIEDTGEMRLQWAYQTRARRIDAEAAETVARDARRVQDNTGFSWDLGLARSRVTR